MNFSTKKHKKCPVCEMIVFNDVISHSFRGIEFWFCSEQCQIRFKRYSSVFVGDPQHGLSEKQKGTRVIKMHKIVLVSAPDRKRLDEIVIALRQLMGVDFVEIENDEVFVIYDLLQVSLEDIEKAILMSYGPIKDTITEKIRRGIIHYNEECELGNLGTLVNQNHCQKP